MGVRVTCCWGWPHHMCLERFTCMEYGSELGILGHASYPVGGMIISSRLLSSSLLLFSPSTFPHLVHSFETNI